MTERLAEGEEECLDLLAGGTEQRTNEARRWRGRAVERRRFGAERRGRKFGKRECAVDSGETAGSGAAEEAQQHGFSLIVARVGGGNRIQAMSGGGAQEKRIACAAPRGFQGKMEIGGDRGYIFRFNGSFERKPGGERGDEAGIRFGLRTAEIVVEMEYEQDNTEIGSECGESPEESYRVSTTANGYADAFAGMH
jgi:hypothetical protein